MFKFKVQTNKKRGLITSSKLSEVSPNTMQPYTSKSPRIYREHQLLLLAASLNWRFSESKNKANASYLYVFVRLCYIGRSFYGLDATNLRK